MRASGDEAGPGAAGLGPCMGYSPLAPLAPVTHPRTATYQRGLGDTPSEAATSPQDAPRAKGMLSYRPRAREAPRNRLQPVNLTPIREAA